MTSQPKNTSSASTAPLETESNIPATGTLAHAALPGAAFHPRDFDIEVSQVSLAGADELLKRMLEEALRDVGGTRGFLALVDTLSGELVVRFTAGEGWTDDNRVLRVAVGESKSESGRRGITRHVLINNRPYISGDVSVDPYYLGFFDDVVSEVAVPVEAVEGGAIGVINIESVRPDAFDSSHVEILTEAARRMAILVAMTEHQLREEALIAIGKDLSTAVDLEVLISHVVERATKILRAEDCSLFLMEDEDDKGSVGGILELVASYGTQKTDQDKPVVRYQMGEGLTGWVAQTGKVIRVGDPRTDSRWKGLFMEAPAGEIAAVMAVPVWSGRGKPGVLRVVRRRKGSLYFLPQEFTKADEEVLVTLAGQLAVSIDRTRLLRKLLHSERMAAWGEMSARSAHMIGNTVFGIKGHLNELSYLLNEGGVWEGDAQAGSSAALRLAEVRELAGSLTRGIYRLEAILSEFRDFVLATQLHLALHDANQILRSVTSEGFPRQSNINLVLNLTPGLPLVEVDEAKLKRAFAELIENSIDFQPDGGQLTVRTSLISSEQARALTKTAWDQNVVQIEFIDRGPGLSDLDRERVFTPFYTRKAQGMGLGLSIVKGIIEAHGGVICEIGKQSAVQNELDGAHFLILLPVAKKETHSEPVEEKS